MKYMLISLGLWFSSTTLKAQDQQLWFRAANQTQIYLTYQPEWTVSGSNGGCLHYKLKQLIVVRPDGADQFASGTATIGGNQITLVCTSNSCLGDFNRYQPRYPATCSGPGYPNYSRQWNRLQIQINGEPLIDPWSSEGFGV